MAFFFGDVQAVLPQSGLIGDDGEIEGNFVKVAALGAAPGSGECIKSDFALIEATKGAVVDGALHFIQGFDVGNGETLVGEIMSFGKHQVGMLNRVSYVVVMQGDTYASLTTEFDKMRWELEKYNDVPQGIEPKVGQIVYLQPKRNKAAREYKKHKVVTGETMWSISQKYGVKLNALYKKNCMTPGDEPEAGQEIWLRRKKSAQK